MKKIKVKKDSILIKIELILKVILIKIQKIVLSHKIKHYLSKADLIINFLVRVKMQVEIAHLDYLIWRLKLIEKIKK